MRFIAVVSVFCISMAGSFIYLNPELMRGHALSMFGPVSEINVEMDWPPRLNEKYPDLELSNLDGEKVRLSDFRGKLLIIESVAIPCPACQAFSGGHQLGGFEGVLPQAGLNDFKTHFQEWTGRSLEDGPVRLIQIIFYGSDGRKSATLEEAQRWADHFSPALPDDAVILFADSSLLSSKTRQMIPGFQLVDLNFILRCDAGNPPREDIFNGLLMKLRSALNQLEGNL